MSIIDMKTLVKKKETSKEKNEVSDIESTIKSVQANGYKEIQEYERLVNDFIYNAKQLAIFNKVIDDVLDNQMRFFLIDEILNAFVKMIFEGNQPPFLDTESYKNIREDMYNNLVEKYINNKK